ncbi:MAG TPA: hypothetical protein VN836_00840 [Verrucomicrobiae bacterium]|nr:hypothetical protein [Verrucomicrobiae bacterium]
MTPDEFRQLLVEQTDLQMLGPCLHDDITPFVFEPKPDTWNAFRDELAVQLGVARGDVRVVGSGRLGFSMKPQGNLVGFKDKSDIDVVIVNADIFDHLWFSLLDAAYPRRPFTDANRLGGWLRDRSSEVYTGWITPLEIRLDSKIYGPKAKPVLEFNVRWFNTLKQVSRHPPRRHEDVEGRLYRTWRHAELYHLHSLAVLRKSLLE